jgi:predicted O-linked N-acetylglucosamine transferase (SPINDLY family)
LPSLYNYKGVALHNAQQLEESEKAFAEGLLYFPTDTRSLLNLGEARTQLFKLDEAIDVFERAEALGEASALSKLLRAKGWSASWYDFERIAAGVEREAMTCASTDERTSTACQTDSLGGLEYTDTPGHVQKLMNTLAPNSQNSVFTIPLNKIAQFWNISNINNKKSSVSANHRKSSTKSASSRKSRMRKRLKVGFISSDFGVHPVATLIRGLVQFLDREYIELFCFAINPKISWWGENITATAEHFVWLQGMNTQVIVYGSFISYYHGRFFVLMPF